MSAHAAPLSSRFATTVAELSQPRDVRALALPALHLVIGLRLCALFERAGREPVGELSARFGSVTAAIAMLEVARLISRSWPEPYTAGRPCCMKMTPDEATLAAMGRAACTGDRRTFRAALDGFIRADRHEPLFAATVRCVTAFPQP